MTDSRFSVCAHFVESDAPEASLPWTVVGPGELASPGSVALPGVIKPQCVAAFTLNGLRSSDVHKQWSQVGRLL